MRDSKCKAIYGDFSCTLDTEHSGQHRHHGVLWEENIKIPVTVEHFIIEGSITGHHHLWTEFTTPDGRKFGKRDYQLIDLTPEDEKYISPITGEEK